MAEQVRPAAEQPLLGNIVGNLFGIGVPAAAASQDNSNIARLKEGIQQYGAPAEGVPHVQADTLQLTKNRLFQQQADRAPAIPADHRDVAARELAVDDAATKASATKAAAAEATTKAAAEIDAAKATAADASIAGQKSLATQLAALTDSVAKVSAKIDVLTSMVQGVGEGVAAVGAQAVQHYTALKTQGSQILSGVQENLALTKDINGVLGQFRAGGWLGAAKLFLQSETFVLIATILTRQWMPNYTETFLIYWLLWRIPARIVSRTAFKWDFSMAGLVFNLTCSPGAILMAIALCVNMYSILKIEVPDEFKSRFPGEIESAVIYIGSLITTQMPSILLSGPGLPPERFRVCKPGEGCVGTEAPGIVQSDITRGTSVAPVREATPEEAQLSLPDEEALSLPPEITILSVQPQTGVTMTVSYTPLNATQYDDAQNTFDRIEDEDEKLEADGYTTPAAKAEELSRRGKLKIGAEAFAKISQYVSDGIEASIRVAPVIWGKIWELIGSSNRNQFIILLARVIVTHIVEVVTSRGVSVSSEILLQIKDHAFNTPLAYLGPLLGFMLKKAAAAAATQIPSWTMGALARVTSIFTGGRHKIGGERQLQMQMQMQVPNIRMNVVRESVLHSLHTVGYHLATHKLYEKLSGGKYRINPDLESAAENAILSAMLLDATYSSEPQYGLDFIKELRDDDISAQILGGNPKSKKKRTYKRGKPSNRKTQLRRRRLLVGKRDAQL
jgi:hypothetical protein